MIAVTRIRVLLARGFSARRDTVTRLDLFGRGQFHNEDISSAWLTCRHAPRTLWALANLTLLGGCADGLNYNPRGFGFRVINSTTKHVALAHEAVAAFETWAELTQLF